MKDKKGYIIFFTIIALYVVIVVALFGWKNVLKNVEKSYIIISPTTKWEYVKGRWIDSKDEKLYNWQTFETYVNSKYIGKYQAFYNKKWYLFDENRKSLSIDGDIIGIKGNIDIDVIAFDEQAFTELDNNRVETALKELGIIPKEYSHQQKIEIDLNGDGKKETIYSVSNVFLTGEEQDNFFSLVFVVKDGKNQILYQDKGTEELKMCVPNVQNIIDIKKDKKYEIILSCTYFDQLGTCHSLYQLEKNQYKIKKSCQEG